MTDNELILVMGLIWVSAYVLALYLYKKLAGI